VPQRAAGEHRNVPLLDETAEKGDCARPDPIDVETAT
jgi:hypothetical protein